MLLMRERCSTLAHLMPTEVQHVGDYDAQTDGVQPLLVHNPHPADAIPQDLYKGHFPGREEQIIAGAKRTDEQSEADVLIIRSSTEVRVEDDVPKRCMYIARPGVGLDQVDQEMCARMGVMPENFRPESAEGVSERILSFLLDWRGGITESKLLYETSQQPTKFPKIAPREIADTTALLVGHGEIGSRTRERMHQIFPDLQILIHDPTPVKPIPEDKRIERADNLHDALARAQIVSVSVPGEAGTVLGKEEFKHIQPGTLIINTSRGVTVDTCCLLWHLLENEGSCGIDVFPDENDLEKLWNDSVFRRIREHPRAMITGHTAGSYPEVLRGNVLAALCGVLDFADCRGVNLRNSPGLLLPGAERELQVDTPGSCVVCTHPYIEGGMLPHVRNAAEAHRAAIEDTDRSFWSMQSKKMGVTMFTMPNSDPKAAAHTVELLNDILGGQVGKGILRSRVAVFRSVEVPDLMPEEQLLHAMFGRMGSLRRIIPLIPARAS